MRIVANVSQKFIMGIFAKAVYPARKQRPWHHFIHDHYSDASELYHISLILNNIQPSSNSLLQLCTSTASDTCAVEVHINRLDMQHSVLGRRAKRPGSVVTVNIISVELTLQSSPSVSLTSKSSTSKLPLFWAQTWCSFARAFHRHSNQSFHEPSQRDIHGKQQSYWPQH